jgi:hypothetical protein
MFRRNSFRDIIMATVIMFCGLGFSARSQQGFNLPAEWKPNESVWIDWEALFTSILPVTVEMVKALQPHVNVKLSTSSDSQCLLWEIPYTGFRHRAI